MTRTILLATALSGLALSASAQTTACAGRERIVAILSERFGETPRSMGLAANGSVFEVFASDATGSWTITMTTPDGRTCLMASGEAYGLIDAPPPGIDG